MSTERKFTPAQRLIVSADFRPDRAEKQGRVWVRRQVLELAKALRGTDICLKMNSALRACGYSLIEEVHNCGLGVCADLKLVDIGETLATDGMLLTEARPDIVTVFLAAGPKALMALKGELLQSEVIGVSALTHLTHDDSYRMFGRSIEDALINFGAIAAEAGLDGFVAAPREVRTLRSRHGDIFTYNTPNVRSEAIEGDDQNPERTGTITQAIRSGATRVIMGRSLAGDNPYDRVMRAVDEIAAALEPIEL